jgi:hypothetical protein
MTTEEPVKTEETVITEDRKACMIKLLKRDFWAFLSEIKPFILLSIIIVGIAILVYGALIYGSALAWLIGAILLLDFAVLLSATFTGKNGALFILYPICLLMEFLIIIAYAAAGDGQTFPDPIIPFIANTIAIFVLIPIARAFGVCYIQKK